jgi:hypothetical protein
MYSGIFAQASKSLDEYRATIAKQTEQITTLEETASTAQQKLEEVNVELNNTNGRRIILVCRALICISTHFLGRGFGYIGIRKQNEGRSIQFKNK